MINIIKKIYFILLLISAIILFSCDAVHNSIKENKSTTNKTIEQL